MVVILALILAVLLFGATAVRDTLAAILGFVLTMIIFVAIALLAGWGVTLLQVIVATIVYRVIVFPLMRRLVGGPKSEEPEL